MKVRSSVAPSNAFTVHPQPKKPGYVAVRFYEGATPYEEERMGRKLTGWEYDMYVLEMTEQPDMSDYVLNNYEALLEQAKIEEEKITAPTLAQRVESLEGDNSSLKQQITDLQLAICDVYESVVVE